MATNFTDVYDQIRAIIPTLTGFDALSKRELFDPYDLLNNDRTSLRNGWGVAIGDTSPSAQQEMGNVYTDFTFIVKVTNEYRGTSHNRTSGISASKALFEDLITLKLDFMNVDQIGIPNDVENILFVGTSGIESISTDKTKILTASVTFVAVIKEAF